MNNYIVKLDLIEEFSQNTIWDKLFRINFNDTEFWKEEFHRFLLYLQGEIKAIIAKPASWNNTYVRFKKIISICNYINSYFGMYGDIHQNRKTAVSHFICEVQGEFEKFINGCWINSSLINKFKSLSQNNLSVAKQQIHEAWITNFFQDEKDLQVKKHYKHLSTKLAAHISAFLANNVELQTSSRNSIFVPKSDFKTLLGIKREVLNEAKKNAKDIEKDGWLFHITEAITYKIIRECKDRNFRQKIYREYQKINQAGDFTFKNGKVLKDILYEKHKIAQLMGKNNYAELVLSNYLMNTPKQAYSYLDKIEEALLPTIKNIEQEIKELANIDNVTDLKAWDVPYYIQCLNYKHNTYTHKFEEYFCFENVLPKIISFFEEKFDLFIHKDDFSAVGNKDIICYRIEDKKSKRKGFIILSPYNNPKKSNCYQMDILKSDTIEKNFVIPSIQYIDLLINKSKNNNSNMSFYDMYTTLHEFGHAFHSFFSPIHDQMSKNLKMSWDLIEMPSQFLEHLVYDYDFMKDFSSHYKTGEQMSQEFFLKVIQNQQFFDEYSIYCNIKTYKTQLWVHENFKPYSSKNLQKVVEAKLSKKGIIYNIARDDYMTYSDYNLDYGPSGYIYLYSAQLAYQLYAKKPKDLRKIFTNTFNSNRKKDLKEHMENNFNITKIDIHKFIKKGLPIKTYSDLPVKSED